MESIRVAIARINACAGDLKFNENEILEFTTGVTLKLTLLLFHPILFLIKSLKNMWKKIKDMIEL